MPHLRKPALAVAVLFLAAPACKRPEGDGSPVLAKVGDGAVTEAEFKAHLEEQPAFLRSRLGTPERRKEYLDQLVRYELLAQEARRQGLDKDPEVQATFERLLVQRLLQKHTTQAAGDVTDAEAEAYYKEQLAEFMRPERVRVSQLLLAATEAQRPAMRQTAVQLAAEARRREAAGDTKAFADLVARRSDDLATRQLAGDLGFKTREELTTLLGSDFAAAAFGLRKEGDIVEVASSRGIHLVKLTGSQEALEQPYPTVKPRIQARLQLEKRSKSVDTLVAELKEKAGVSVDEAALAKVAVEPAPAAAATATAPKP